MNINEGQTIWIEKYRPTCVQDLVLPEYIKKKFKTYVDREDIPNLGFFSANPGCGKTSSAIALVKEINGEALFINASMDRGIDVLRNQISNFASTESFDGKLKIVIMDECLEENEEVILGTLDSELPTKLNDMCKNKVYDCVSYNMDTQEFENDTCEIISDRIADIYEVHLEDDRTIKVTSNHPFIIQENDKIIEKSIENGLKVGNDVVLKSCNKESMKIKSIKKMSKPDKARVINLTVHKNHTFVTKNGIVTHNCDAFSPDAQFAFRSLIESFANNCRFIFTANYKEKIIEPLIDRLECYDFNSFDKKTMVKPIFEHLKAILDNEKITYEPKDLVPVINTFYPSIRGMVGALQKFSVGGALSIDVNDMDDQNEYQKIIDLVLKKDFIGTINAVNNLNSPDNMYTFLYKKLSNFKNITSTVIILAKYQFQSSSVRDKNLNLSACLTEIMSTV